MRHNRLVVCAIALWSIFFHGGWLLRAHAQTDARSLQWDRWDVTIDNIVTSRNSFDVTETHVLHIFKGPYRFGFREIPLDRLTGIDNVSVSQDGKPFSAGCAEALSTFCVSKTSDNFERITYYFASPTADGTTPTIQIKYTVHGALRSFSNGDELAWKALADDRPFPVMASVVRIILPDGLNPLEYGSDPKTWKQSKNGQTLAWTAPGPLGKTDNVEIGVKYPHDPTMKPPPWQAPEPQPLSPGSRIIYFVLTVVFAWLVIFVLR